MLLRCCVMVFWSGLVLWNCRMLCVRRLRGRRLCLWSMARLIPARLVHVILIDLIVNRLVMGWLVDVRRLSWILMDRLGAAVLLHPALIVSLHRSRHVHIAVRSKRLTNSKIRRAALVDAGKLRTVDAGSVFVL